MASKTTAANTLPSTEKGYEANTLLRDDLGERSQLLISSFEPAAGKELQKSWRTEGGDWPDIVTSDEDEGGSPKFFGKVPSDDLEEKRLRDERANHEHNSGDESPLCSKDGTLLCPGYKRILYPGGGIFLFPKGSESLHPFIGISGPTQMAPDKGNSSSRTVLQILTGMPEAIRNVPTRFKEIRRVILGHYVEHRRGFKASAVIFAVMGVFPAQFRELREAILGYYFEHYGKFIMLVTAGFFYWVLPWLARAPIDDLSQREPKTPTHVDEVELYRKAKQMHDSWKDETAHSLHLKFESEYRARYEELAHMETVANRKATTAARIEARYQHRLIEETKRIEGAAASQVQEEENKRTAVQQELAKLKKDHQIHIRQLLDDHRAETGNVKGVDQPVARKESTLTTRDEPTKADKDFDRGGDAGFFAGMRAFSDNPNVAPMSPENATWNSIKVGAATNPAAYKVGYCTGYNRGLEEASRRAEIRRLMD